MRKLIALLLILTLAVGLVPAAFAKSYTLDIYWIANVNTDLPYKNVGNAISEYLADEKNDQGDLAAVTKEAIAEYLTEEEISNAKITEGVENAINAYLAQLYEEKKIKEIQVKFHLVSWDPVWTEEAIGDLLADKKIDLIFTADWEGYVQEIRDGKLSPLEDLLKSDGQGILDTLSADFLEGIKVDSQIYGIPTNKELCVPSGFIVNKTAALEIGWDPDENPVKTTEELEPWLAAYKEKYPDRYPYLMEKDRWADEPWGHEWIGLPEDVLNMKFATDEDGKFDETVYSIFETEEQEKHIRLMYDWMQKGYIDPGAADPNYNYNETFGTGNFLVFTQPLKGSNFKSIEMYGANHREGDPEFECTEIVMQPKYKVTNQAGGSMFAIPKSSKHKDRAMQYLNLMHSDPTLVNLMLFGAEGVNYTKVNDQQVELNPDANWYGMHGGAWTVGNTKLQYVLTTEDPEKNAKLQEYALDAPMTASYGFRFNKNKAKTLDKVTEAVDKYAFGLMTGGVNPDDPELGLEAFRAALKEAGIDELKAEVEAQYETWKTDSKK